MDFKHLLFAFGGRIPRKEFWIGTLTLAVASVVLNVTAFQFLGLTLDDLIASKREAVLVGFAVTLVLLWPGLAITIKRLHDRNRTGWWAALIYGLVVASDVFDLIVPSKDEELSGIVSLGIGAVLLIVGIWLLIEVGFLKGTQGPNRYGPDPLGAKQADASF